MRDQNSGSPEQARWENLTPQVANQNTVYTSSCPLTIQPYKNKVLLTFISCRITEGAQV